MLGASWIELSRWYSCKALPHWTLYHKKSWEQEIQESISRTFFRRMLYHVQIHGCSLLKISFEKRYLEDLEDFLKCSNLLSIQRSSTNSPLTQMYTVACSWLLLGQPGIVNKTPDAAMHQASLGKSCPSICHVQHLHECLLPASACISTPGAQHRGPHRSQTNR